MPSKIKLSHFDLIGFVFDLIGFGATSTFAYFLYFYVFTGLIMLLRHDSLRFVAMASAHSRGVLSTVLLRRETASRRVEEGADHGATRHDFRAAYTRHGHRGPIIAKNGSDFPAFLT